MSDVPPKDEPSFLGRWSRRKTESRAGQGDEPVPVTEDGNRGELEESGARATASDRDEAKAPPPDLPPPDLPPIESLTAESDFTQFMKEGVPEEMRRLALRRLWRLNPVYANLDGLVDYGGDFTDAATAAEAVQTLYKVGKGFLEDEPGETDSPAGTETDVSETALEESALASSDGADAQGSAESQDQDAPERS